jgi:hypothetical protein
MTPSGWHDDARNRDAGHDEMQLAVRNYLLGEKRSDCNGVARTHVLFEYPFIRRGQIIAWGDVVELWQDEKGTRACAVWEIKPKIYSIGAVIRQCVALNIAVRDALTDRHSGRCEARVVVHPVVKSGDPKLSMLRDVTTAFGWDGKRMSAETEQAP